MAPYSLKSHENQGVAGRTNYSAPVVHVLNTTRGSTDENHLFRNRNISRMGQKELATYVVEVINESKIFENNLDGSGVNISIPGVTQGVRTGEVDTGLMAGVPKSPNYDGIKAEETKVKGKSNLPSFEQWLGNFPDLTDTLQMS